MCAVSREHPHEICRQIAGSQIAPSAGNISARAGDEIVITPSVISCRRLQPDDIVQANLTIAAVTGDRRPTTELEVHPDRCKQDHKSVPSSALIPGMRVLAAEQQDAIASTYCVHLSLPAAASLEEVESP